MTDPSTPDSGSKWTHVPRADESAARPRRAADLDPSDDNYLDLDANQPGEATPRSSPTETFASLPRAARIGIALACAVVLIVVAGLLGRWLAGPTGDPSTMPAESRGPWPMTAPANVGDYHLDQTTAAPTPSTLHDNSKALLTATYSAGDKHIVLLLTRPETDPHQLMLDAAMQNTTVVNDAYCGTSTDTGRPACALVVDDTGVLVVGPSSTSNESLVDLLNQFVETLQEG